MPGESAAELRARADQAWEDGDKDRSAELHERARKLEKLDAAIAAGVKLLQTPTEADRDSFHAHLDACAQCRDHPMALCAVGAGLLRIAAVGR